MNVSGAFKLLVGLQLVARHTSRYGVAIPAAVTLATRPEVVCRQGAAYGDVLPTVRTEQAASSKPAHELTL